jgi:hypothetical protein
MLLERLFRLPRSMLNVRSCGVDGCRPVLRMIGDSLAVGVVIVWTVQEQAPFLSFFYVFLLI